MKRNVLLGNLAASDHPVKLHWARRIYPVSRTKLTTSNKGIAQDDLLLVKEPSFLPSVQRFGFFILAM